MGTCVPGPGTSVRHALRGVAISGRTSGTGLGITAGEADKTNGEPNGAAPLGSDAAQQLSASAWLMARSDAWALGVRFLCIGLEPPSEQHAIRASGVAAQPAQRATGLADSDMLNRTATTRRLKINTVLRMLDGRCQPMAVIANLRRVPKKSPCHYLPLFFGTLAGKPDFSVMALAIASGVVFEGS